MGKRKVRRKIIKFTQPKVPTIFDCPFCNYKKCISVKINKKKGKYFINCNHCNTNYSDKISHLTEPVDAYYEWIDLCEKINKEEKNKDFDNEKKDENDEDDY